MHKTKKIVDEIVFVSRIQKYLRLLNWIPFLRGIYVCNNVSFGVYDESEDIDLFVVAKKNRLFIVRILVTIILQFAGVRRYGNKIANRFCLSFFIDESFYDFSKIAIENDIYLAFWIASLKPVIDDGFLNYFLVKNVWINSFGEKFSSFCEFNGFKYNLKKSCNVFILKRSFVSKFFKIFFEILLFAPLGNVFNFLLSSWQLKRARKKALSLSSKSSILLQRNILKFHNEDQRRLYRDKFFLNL